MSPKLQQIDTKLDALIANASALRECEEDLVDDTEFKHKQETLLQELFDLHQSLNASETEAVLKNTPRLYKKLENKISKFSQLNASLVRPSY